MPYSKIRIYELLGKENICSNINEALEVATREIAEFDEGNK